MRRRGWLGTILALPVAISSAAAAAASPEPRVGWAVVPGQLTSIIFAKPELLPHCGQSYTVQFIHFRGSAPQNTALVAREFDVATLAFSSFGLAIQNARVKDLRAIGDLYRDGIGDYYANEYLVRADGPIHKIEDLKGRVLVADGIGGAFDMAPGEILRDHGLDDKRDYQIVEIQFPNMARAPVEKKVDLTSMVMRFVPTVTKTGKVRTRFTIKDAMGEAQTRLMAARRGFIDARRAVLVDSLEDWQRAMRWYYDSANRTETIKDIVDVTKQPASIYEEWSFTRRDCHRNSEVILNLKALQRNLDVQKELGLLAISVDVGKYAGLSLINEAAQRPR